MGLGYILFKRTHIFKKGTLIRTQYIPKKFEVGDIIKFYNFKVNM